MRGGRGETLFHSLFFLTFSFSYQSFSLGQSRKKLSLRIGLSNDSEKPLETIRGKMIEFLSALKRWGRRKRKKKFDQTRR